MGGRELGWSPFTAFMRWRAVEWGCNGMRWVVVPQGGGGKKMVPGFGDDKQMSSFSHDSQRDVPPPPCREPEKMG